MLHSFASGWLDLDLDGVFELYLVNHFGNQYDPNHLLQGFDKREGGFTSDISELTGTDVAVGGMGLGFGDVNALIRLAATNPEEAPLCVYQMYNKPPFTVAVLQSSDIMTAEDLQGRKTTGTTVLVP